MPFVASQRARLSYIESCSRNLSERRDFSFLSSILIPGESTGKPGSHLIVGKHEYRK